MATVSQSLEKLLADVFENTRDIDDAEAHAKQKSEFVFHLTDCKDDLLRLADLYREPERFSDTEAEAIIAATVYHIVGHFIAAARLYDYVPDPFKPPE